MDSAGEGMAIFDAMRARRAEGSGGVKLRGCAGDFLCAGPGRAVLEEPKTNVNSATSSAMTR